MRTVCTHQLRACDYRDEGCQFMVRMLVLATRCTFATVIVGSHKRSPQALQRTMWIPHTADEKNHEESGASYGDQDYNTRTAEFRPEDRAQLYENEHWCESAAI